MFDKNFFKKHIFGCSKKIRMQLTEISNKLFSPCFQKGQNIVCKCNCTFV